ncbi:MAG: hypothetical protein PHT77_10235 [Bacteroidales bacterium]|nr:hypothetical protein [Bacteroidales bacterium]
MEKFEKQMIIILLVCGCLATGWFIDFFSTIEEQELTENEAGDLVIEFLDSDITKIRIQGDDGFDVTFEKTQSNQTVHIYGITERQGNESGWMLYIYIDTWLTYDEVREQWGE